MSLIRCKRHGKPRKGKYTYPRFVKPVGWSKTAAICVHRT